MQRLLWSSSGRVASAQIVRGIAARSSGYRAIVSTDNAGRNRHPVLILRRIGGA